MVECVSSVERGSNKNIHRSAGFVGLVIASLARREMKRTGGGWMDGRESDERWVRAETKRW